MQRSSFRQVQAAGAGSSSNAKRPRLGSSPSNGSKQSSDCQAVEQLAVYDGLTSVCQTFMLKAGLVLPSNKPPFLRVDQAVFQHDLEAALKNHSSYPQIVEEFVESFAEHIEDVQKLFWCLNMTYTDEDCTSARSFHQAAVIRILLSISDVQPLLMGPLLLKLLELSVDNNFLTNGGELKHVPKMILSHIKRLDVVADSSMLCDKLLEIMSVAHVDIQKEIIDSIPEILEDKDHEKVVIAWSELLKRKTALTANILDSITFLCIASDVQEEVQHIVMDSIEFVNVETIPVVLKFLMQCVTSENAIEILSEIRLRLEFSTEIWTAYKKDTKQSYEVLALESIKIAVQLKRVVGEALVKVLERSKAEKKPKLLDLFLIFVLVEVNAYKKAAENIMVTKICNGSINESLVRNAFQKHTSVCQEYCKSVLLLVDVLFSSTDDTVLKFGGLFAIVSFTENNDPSMRQEVIFTMVIRLRKERKAEIDIILDSIQQIVTTHTQRVVPFSCFLKSLLDRLEWFSLSHVSKVYEILNILGQASKSDSNGILSDLHIIVRKQLSNPDQRYRRMGVIGALITLRGYGTASISDEDLSNAKTLITLIEQLVAKDCEAKSLFYEELSSAVLKRQLHRKLEEWLSEHVTSDFQDDYVIDVDGKSLPEVSDMKGELAFGQDNGSENGVALNLLVGACEDEAFVATAAHSKRSRLRGLPTQFRLVCLCEKVTHDDDMSGIDALLGCPVYIFHSDMLNDFENKPLLQRKIVCRCLLSVINWFIELINAFVTQKNDDEVLGKVITRIRHVVELQQKLEAYLKLMPDFVQPVVRFDLYSLEMPTSETKVKPANTKKLTGKRGQKAKSTMPMTSTQRSTQVSMSSPLDQQVSTSKKTAVVNGCIFRELDMEVFLILRRDVDLKVEEKNNSTVKLRLQELRFLLCDLHTKLEGVLPQKSSSKIPFLSKVKFEESLSLHRHLKARPIADFVKEVARLLKSLRAHLEIIGAFLIEEKARDENDIDDSVYNSQTIVKMELYELAVECFSLIFGCCTTFFSWKGFDEQDNRHTVCKSLLRFAENKGSSQTSLNQCTKAAFDYFQQYSTVVPDFPSAVSLVKLLDSIAQKNQKLNEKLAEICEEFLKREWSLSSEEFKTPKYINNLDCLLKVFFNTSKDTLGALEMMTTEVLPEFIQSKGRNNCSEKFPTLTKATFPIYYHAMFRQLITCLREENKSKTDGGTFETWAIGVRIFNILVMLIKEFSAYKIMASGLKSGSIFLELFLKLAMPIADREFRTHKNDILASLKVMQQSTRYLHILCDHAKVMKNVGLTNSVPRLKKLLETFVFRVKEMFTMNSCNDAFWLGNLKNRNLKGEEILSQPTVNSDDDDDEGGDSNTEITMDTGEKSEDEQISDDESESFDDLLNNRNEKS